LIDLCPASFTRPLDARHYRSAFSNWPRAAFCLASTWLTFFHAVKIAGGGIATLGFASFPALL